MRILVVDDSSAIRMLIEMMIRRMPEWQHADIHHCECGSEALAYLEHAALPPDIVLCNLCLPRLNGPDGFDLAALVRADPRWVSVRLVMMSALEAAFARPQLPPDIAYLQKPFRLEDLRAALR